MKTSEFIGLALMEYRKKNNLSRKALAKILGIGDHSLYDIENGQSDFRTSVIDTIMKTIGVIYIGVDDETDRSLPLKRRLEMGLWNWPDIYQEKDK